MVPKTVQTQKKRHTQHTQSRKYFIFILTHCRSLNKMVPPRNIADTEGKTAYSDFSNCCRVIAVD